MAPLTNYSRVFALGSPPEATVIPSAAYNQTAIIQPPEEAGTQKIVLTNQGWANGARLVVKAELPLIEGIVLDFRLGDEDGSQLLPTERFPDQTYTSDGYVQYATFEFVKIGNTSWRYVSAAIPS